MRCCGFHETGGDVGGLEHPQRLAAHAQPGVVVDQVEDLHIGAVSQRPVGDVELPPLVGLLGGEPQIAAFRPLVRLRGDEPAGREDPPDRRRRQAGGVALVEVERDRRRTGFVPAPVEFLAQLHDLVLDRLNRPLWTCQRSPGPRGQTVLALGQVALHQGDHPPPRDPVLAGDLALGAAFDHNSRDDQLRHTHRSPLGSGCERCPATGVNNVLNSDTAAPTSLTSSFVGSLKNAANPRDTKRDANLLYHRVMTRSTSKRSRTRGAVDSLPSGALRVRVYAGEDPLTGKRHDLIEIIPPGPHPLHRPEGHGPPHPAGARARRALPPAPLPAAVADDGTVVSRSTRRLEGAERTVVITGGGLSDLRRVAAGWATELR